MKTSNYKFQIPNKLQTTISKYFRAEPNLDFGFWDLNFTNTGGF